MIIAFAPVHSNAVDDEAMADTPGECDDDEDPELEECVGRPYSPATPC